MLTKVREQRPSYNNSSAITSSVTVSSIKLLYYKFFAWLFSLTAYGVDIAIVNSSWTENHIRHMWANAINHRSHHTRGILSILRVLSVKFPWSNAEAVQLVKIFPPCNTQHSQSIPLVANSDMIVKENITVNSVVDCSNLVRDKIILSVGQFRPEKDHALQLE
jgi:alpha-1,2-mannosyltransferase